MASKSWSPSVSGMGNLNEVAHSHRAGRLPVPHVYNSSHNIVLPMEWQESGFRLPERQSICWKVLCSVVKHWNQISVGNDIECLSVQLLNGELRIERKTTQLCIGSRHCYRSYASLCCRDHCNSSTETVTSDRQAIVIWIFLEIVYKPSDRLIAWYALNGLRL